jgi:predicted methyltransferase
MITINDIVAASHLFVAQHVRRGDTVVDATAGNGHDTLFLARLVGAGGKVHAFDIQETALEKTRALLIAHTCEQWVELHLKDHGELAQVVEGPVQAAMFNLGYLPGGDKQITTHAHSSLRALANCLGVLAPGGIISVVTYSGHRGGEEEEAEVAGWCRSLPARDYTVVSFSLINKPNRPPKLWLIRRQER